MLRRIRSNKGSTVCTVMVAIPTRVHAVRDPTAQPAPEETADTRKNVCFGGVLIFHSGHGRLMARGTCDHLGFWSHLLVKNCHWGYALHIHFDCVLKISLHSICTVLGSTLGVGRLTGLPVDVGTYTVCIEELRYVLYLFP